MNAATFQIVIHRPPLTSGLVTQPTAPERIGLPHLRCLRIYDNLVSVGDKIQPGALVLVPVQINTRPQVALIVSDDWLGVKVNGAPAAAMQFISQDDAVECEGSDLVLRICMA